MVKSPSAWEKLYERGGFVPLNIVAWAGYLFVAPYVWTFHKGWGIAFMIFPGLFISNLLIYFQHECWHNYFKTRLNRPLFIVLSTILFVQPHLYDIGHRSHHSRVNTYDDLELYPIGKIQNRILRCLCNCLSIVLGSLFLVLLGGRQESGLPRSSATVRFLATYAAAFLIWGGIAYASFAILAASKIAIFLSYFSTIWMVSVFHHHHELIEHGNLLVEGDFKFRSSQTRNFAADSIAQRFFLFMAHQDSREHTLHHTHPSFYSRPFVGRYEMPKDAVYIDFKEYAAILLSMALGKETVIKQVEMSN